MSEERPQIDPTLYVTDEEMIARMGVLPEVAAPVIRELDRKGAGFPQPDPLFKKRYWPAVKEWLDRRNRLKIDVPAERRPARPVPQFRSAR